MPKASAKRIKNENVALTEDELAAIDPLDQFEPDPEGEDEQDLNFDFFTFVPLITKLMGGTAFEFYGITWTMNRANILDLLELYDRGNITRISLMTGICFQRRRPGIYATLVQGLKKRRQRYRAAINHAKITLLTDGQKNFITIEGSANYTGNPRIENFIISNSREVYQFHRAWIEEIFNE